MTCPAWTQYVMAKEFCFGPGVLGHVFASLNELSWIPFEPFSALSFDVPVESAAIPARIEPRYASYCSKPPGTPLNNEYFGAGASLAIDFTTDIPGTVAWSYQHFGNGDIAPYFDLESGRLTVPYAHIYPFEFTDCNNDPIQATLHELIAFDGQLRVSVTVGGLTYGPATLTFSGTVLTEVSFT